MSNRIALELFLVIAAAVATDLLAGWGVTLFLVKKFFGLVDWVIFWN
jgi:hypothetical protein